MNKMMYMSDIQKTGTQVFLALIMSLAIFLCCFDHPFFWDSIQFGSEHAHWYYSTDFKYFFLPTEYDSGHPPFFGMYIALCWKVLGRTLWVSHLAMAPFTFLSFLLLLKIGRAVSSSWYLFFVLLFFFADPMLVTQHILVSPDVPLFTGFLMGYYSVLKNNRIGIACATLLLSLISMRGLMVAAAFGMYELYNLYVINKTYREKVRLTGIYFLYYVPGVFVFAGFMIAHKLEKGWIGYHPDSPWAAAFEHATLSDIFRNILVAGFRFFEFGRIGVLFLLAFVLVYFRKFSFFPRQEFILFCTLILTLLVPQLMYKELLNPRYFIPVFFCLSILLIKTILKLPYKKNIFKSALVCAALLLFSGNLWRYPRGIAMSWDCTLQHTFYFNARKDMLAYIESMGIPFQKIGAHFPEYGPLHFIDLRSPQQSMKEMEPRKDEYIYYSSVMNLTDEQYVALDRFYMPIKTFQNGMVSVVLYRKID